MSLILLFNYGQPYQADGDVQATAIGLYKSAGDLIAQLRVETSVAYRALGDVQARTNQHAAFQGDVRTGVQARLRTTGDFSAHIGKRIRRSGDFSGRLAANSPYASAGDFSAISGVIYRSGGDVSGEVQTRTFPAGAQPYTAAGDMGDALAYRSPFAGDFSTTLGRLYRTFGDVRGVSALAVSGSGDLSANSGNYQAFGDLGDAETQEGPYPAPPGEYSPG